MKLILVSNEYFEIVCDSMPCILNEGEMVIPIDCLDVVGDLNLPDEIIDIPTN
jgi:hypothetical protein